MRNFHLVILFLPLICLSQRQEIHCKHFFFGYPYGSPKSNDLIIRDIYALSNNDEKKFADWVAYKLTMHEVDGHLDIERKWRTDPWLDENETLEPSPKKEDDYKDAHSRLNLDRGHLAPLASFKGSRFASQANYYSNITPQKAELNQGAWKILEEGVRHLVRSKGEVYVMTGPTYSSNTTQLPNADESHHIPNGYWKIIGIIEGSEIKTFSFFFEQNISRDADILNHLTTIEYIESKTGLEFLWLLSEIDQKKIKSKTNEDIVNLYFSK